MMILFWFLISILILVCIVLCFLILIQSDKGGGISGAIGGGLGGASSLLGTQDTANILTRGTVIFGSAFLVLCILLSFIISKQTVTVDKSLLQKRAEKQQGYSPSSVLGGNAGGLPIQQGAPGGSSSPQAGGVPAGEPTQAAASSAAGTLPIQGVPEAKGQALPKGTVPVTPPAGKSKGK